MFHVLAERLSDHPFHIVWLSVLLTIVVLVLILQPFKIRKRT